MRLHGCSSKQTRPMLCLSFLGPLLSQSRFHIVIRLQIIFYKTERTGKHRHCIQRLFGEEGFLSEENWTSVLPSLICERREVLVTHSSNTLQENESSVCRDPDSDALYAFLFLSLLFLDHRPVYERNSKHINSSFALSWVCETDLVSFPGLGFSAQSQNMTCDARGPDIHQCVQGMTIKALCDVYKHAVWD